MGPVNCFGTPAAISHVDDRSSVYFTVDDVLPLLPGSTPRHSKVGECMGLV